MSEGSDMDAYERYAEEFDPAWGDLPAERGRKRQAKPAPKKTQRQIVAELAEPEGLEAGFVTTYQPARYEAEWLRAALDVLPELEQQHEEQHGDDDQRGQRRDPQGEGWVAHGPVSRRGRR